MPQQLTKQPREEIDFDFDFEITRRLADDEVLIGATVTYEGTDRVLTVFDVSWSDTRVKVWTKGGSDGGRYKITALATTSGGRKLENEFLLLVKDK